MRRYVVTGARGFLGRAFMARFPAATALSLSGPDWPQRIAACDFDEAAVIHLGARAHGPEQEDAAFADAAEKARVLANAAGRGGARVLVFTSSIKVNGEETHGRPFTAQDAPDPRDAYARSKLAAEEALRGAAEANGLALHIVRPPLVYGPDARGNLRRLLGLCDSPLPLPFASVRNRRSFVAREDLLDLLVRCAESTRRETSLWLAAHPEPVSTADLVARLREALGRPRRLFSVPAGMLAAAARVAGHADVARRLLQSLVIDARPAYDTLGWQPRVSIDEAVRDMAAHWRARGDRR